MLQQRALGKYHSPG
ncbi:hypothetical protein, partial [Escherichia coli]